MVIMQLINKVSRRLLKLRLQPIRVFCFHQVSEVFDKNAMWECDWIQIDQFKTQIRALMEDYSFISLPEAQQHLKNDIFRRRKYAVLTADDGYRSLLNILPWLNDNKIPITLFINPSYIIGAEVSEKGADSMLSESDFKDILLRHAPCIQIAAHGWNHKAHHLMYKSEFTDSVQWCIKYLRKYDEYIPFYAYPYGKRTQYQDEYLLGYNITPVLMDGQKNYMFDGFIHREELR